MINRKHLINIKAFFGSKSSEVTITRICRLSSTNSWRKWTDGNGNFLTFKANRVMSIIKNKDIKEDVIKDIYYKADIKSISKRSHTCMISKCDYCYYIWFLGSDETLRLRILQNGDFLSGFPILHCGVSCLKYFAKNIHIVGYKVLMGKLMGPNGENIEKTWVCQWPPNDNMKMDLMLTDKQNGEKILYECGVL